MKKVLYSLLAFFMTCSVQAQQPCNAQYYADSVPNGGMISFYDYSSVANGSVNTWWWEVSDTLGNILDTSSLQNPSFGFNAYGMYSVCLTITGMDSVGIMLTCQSCQLYQYSFLGFVPVNSQAVVSWNCVGGACIDPGNGTGAYLLYTDCMQNCGTPPTPSWDCTFSGCVDPGNGTGAYVTLSDCQSACTPAASPCDGGFTFVPDSVNIMPVTFTDTTQYIGGGQSWYWTFSDTLGNLLGSSQLQSPQFSFNSFGVFEVCLTATGMQWDSLTNDTIMCTRLLCDTFVYNGSGFFKLGNAMSHIQSFMEEKVEERIYDLHGREWKRPFADLPKGVYIINNRKVLKL